MTAAEKKQRSRAMAKGVIAKPEVVVKPLVDPASKRPVGRPRKNMAQAGVVMPDSEGKKMIEKSISDTNEKEVIPSGARTTSVSKKMAIYKSCKDMHNPPVHIPLDQPSYAYWAGVMSRRAFVDWNDNDLCLAATLCRMMAMLDNEIVLLANEGPMVFNEVTQMSYKNPRVDVVKSLHAAVTTQQRLLGLNGSQIGGAKKYASGLAEESNAKSVFGDVSDGLLQ